MAFGVSLIAIFYTFYSVLCIVLNAYSRVLLDKLTGS
jgi:hypothetical protein